MLVKKMIATLIDYFLLIVFLLCYLSFFGKTTADGSKSLQGPVVLIPLCIMMFYLILSEALSGATLGHHAMKLQVVSVDGSKPSLIQIVKRRFADVLDFYISAGFIALISVLVTQNHQRLGDLWAKTLVASYVNYFFTVDFTALLPIIW